VESAVYSGWAPSKAAIRSAGPDSAGTPPQTFRVVAGEDARPPQPASAVSAVAPSPPARRLRRLSRDAAVTGVLAAGPGSGASDLPRSGLQEVTDEGGQNQECVKNNCEPGVGRAAGPRSGADGQAAGRSRSPPPRAVRLAFLGGRQPAPLPGAEDVLAHRHPGRLPVAGGDRLDDPLVLL